MRDLNLRKEQSEVILETAGEDNTLERATPRRDTKMAPIADLNILIGKPANSNRLILEPHTDMTRPQRQRSLVKDQFDS